MKLDPRSWFGRNTAAAAPVDRSAAPANDIADLLQVKRQQLIDNTHPDPLSRAPRNLVTLEGFTRFDVVKLLNGSRNVGIELGVAQGVYSKKMVESGRFRAFYGVDMYADHHSVAEYVDTVKSIGIDSPYKLFRMTFDEALDLFDDEYFDFIYVDGYAHTGENGGATIHDWYDKLKVGGLIAGDDYDVQWPLVMEQVHQFVNLNHLELMVTERVEPDSVWSQYRTWAALKKA